MNNLISVIIPNRNGGRTIGKCLEAVFASGYGKFEVIVVDDCSEDGSAAVIRKFPCRLVKLDRHSGASAARNAGARAGRGEILFFTDADCLVQRDTLSLVAAAAAAHGPSVAVGGTYTRQPHDSGFFSRFQSVFINYFETKHAGRPDYIASHAMAVHARTFLATGGFPETFLPIIEDVEYSHRLRRAGFGLVIEPRLLVEHIFDFDLRASLRNAVRKTAYWVVYSWSNRDLFADSGTASRELKLNVVAFFLMIALLAASAGLKIPALACPVPVLAAANTLASFRLFRAFRETGGRIFALLAYCYYTLVYPCAVGTGAIAGMIKVLAR